MLLAFSTNSKFKFSLLAIIMFVEPQKEFNFFKNYMLGKKSHK